MKAVFQVDLKDGAQSILWAVPESKAMGHIADMEINLAQDERVTRMHFLGWFDNVILAEDRNFPFPEEPLMFQCQANNCGDEFETIADLEAHIRVKHPEEGGE